jgi:hypothetical protein
VPARGLAAREDPVGEEAAVAAVTAEDDDDDDEDEDEEKEDADAAPPVPLGEGGGWTGRPGTGCECASLRPLAEGEAGLVLACAWEERLRGLLDVT